MQQSSRATPPSHFAHVGPGGLKCACCAPQTQRHKRPFFRTAKRRQRRDELRFELRAERAMLANMLRNFEEDVFNVGADLRWFDRQVEHEKYQYDKEDEAKYLRQLRLLTMYAEAVGHNNHYVEHVSTDVVRISRSFVDRTANPDQYWLDDPFFISVAEISFIRGAHPGVDDLFGKFLICFYTNHPAVVLPASEHSFDTAVQYVVALDKMGVLSAPENS